MELSAISGLGSSPSSGKNYAEQREKVAFFVQINLKYDIKTVTWQYCKLVKKSVTACNSV